MKQQDLTYLIGFYVALIFATVLNIAFYIFASIVFANFNILTWELWQRITLVVIAILNYMYHSRAAYNTYYKNKKGVF